MTRPPLELAVEVTDAHGVHTRWDSNSPAARRPAALTFRTSRGTGFADASCSLPRRIDRDYIDLSLLDGVKLIGADGTIAYEGRISALPRSMSDQHQITVQVAGLMAAAADRKFAEIYRDMDLSAWTDAPRTRQAQLLTAGYGTINAPGVQQDEAVMALFTSLQGKWEAPYLAISEAWYDAGPECHVGSLEYGWEKTASVDPTGLNTDWIWRAVLSDDQLQTATDQTGNLRAPGPGSGTLTATTSTRRYASVRLAYATTPAGADGATYGINWQNLAVMGAHTVPVSGGVRASDVIRDICTRFVPVLDPAGVVDTTYEIPHLVFKDRTTAYDAFLKVNAFHLWDLNVWENRTLHFAPVDLTDYDWQVRLDDPGVKVDLQGDTTAEIANGIVVTYQDVQLGTTNVLTPETEPLLADTDPGNVVNQHGQLIWQEITLSAPTTRDAAVQLGRAAFADQTTPKSPGTITVQGHVRDRAGHWQQAWKVRAGDTISITNHPNSRPRLVTETNYDHSSHTVQISVEGQPRRLDAVLDRISTALSARSLA